jgi:hypothetical protein
MNESLESLSKLFNNNFFLILLQEAHKILKANSLPDQIALNSKKRIKKKITEPIQLLEFDR